MDAAVRRCMSFLPKEPLSVKSSNAREYSDEDTVRSFILNYCGSLELGVGIETEFLYVYFIA